MKVAIISDLHGNAAAVKAVLQRIKDSSVDQIYCLGDLVGYYPDPEEVINLVRENKMIAIVGNQDHALVNKIRTGSQIADSILDWTRENVSQENLTFLTSLPKKLEANFGGFRVLLAHGSPWDYLNERIYPDSSLDRFLTLPHEIIVMGHTHIPFVKVIKNKYIINPGSVGQSRDGDPRASFAFLEIINNDVKVKIVRVSYDSTKIIRKIKAVRFPPILKKYLPLKLRNEQQKSKS